MAAANAQLLKTLSDLWLIRGSATITVDSGRIQRVLHVNDGELLAIESDLLTERIGVQLVAEGKLDPTLVTPLVNAARASGRSFCEQAVKELLLEEEEVAGALTRQFNARLDRALLMVGKVMVKQRSPIRPVVRAPVCSAVMASFRRLPVEVASGVVAGLPPRHAPMREDLFSSEQLALEGDELRYFRQLAAGMDVTGVLDRAQNHECALRLTAGIVALGAIVTEVVDPVAQYLRTA